MVGPAGLEPETNRLDLDHGHFGTTTVSVGHGSELQAFGSSAGHYTKTDQDKGDFRPFQSACSGA